MWTRCWTLRNLLTNNWRPSLRASDPTVPAFVELVSRYRERVWRVCFRLLGNADDANDGAQEVFVRMFLNRDRFQGRSKYSTWVHGITLRTCLSLRRGRGRRERRENIVAEQAGRAAGKGDGSAAELSLDLMQMLDVLEDEDRALLILKYAEGHSYEELAETFQIGVSACKMRISRAREKLKQRFSEHSFGAE